MRKLIFTILISIFIIYCIMFPGEMAKATANGLSIWYTKVLPTLLPFSILSYIIIRSNLYHAFFSKFKFPKKKNHHVLAELIYPVIFGFVCGFPIGAKLIADLYESEYLSSKKITAYTCVCNNFGPAFIVHYIGNTLLDGHLPAMYLLVSIYLPSCLLLALLNITKTYSVHNKKPASRSYINFKIIDTGIINGFETMLRIAGYIVLFSILSSMLMHVPGQHAMFQSLVTGLLEVTTGVNQISSLSIPMPAKCSIICGIVSFGGFCGIFQTKSIMKNCPFHTIQYIFLKTCCAFISTCICIILLRITAFTNIT